MLAVALGPWRCVLVLAEVGLQLWTERSCQWPHTLRYRQECQMGFAAAVGLRRGRLALNAVGLLLQLLTEGLCQLHGLKLCLWELSAAALKL